MRCVFRVHYLTQMGEHLQMVLDGKPIRLQWLGGGWWGGIVDVTGDELYHYRVVDNTTLRVDEAGALRSLPEVLVAGQTIVDRWRPADPARLSRHSAFFSKSRAARYATADRPGEAQSHVFRLHEPWLPPGLVPAVVGESPALGEWDPARALRMAPAAFPWWETSAGLDNEAVEYKYVLLGDSGEVVQWESGLNSELPANGHGPLVVHDNGFRGLAGWRGAGVAIPVFSLRTDASVGVGQFTDLIPFADWAADVGLSVIQLLPVNDTILNHDWDDSYPYNPVSVQALHPLYMDVDAIADNGITAEIAAVRAELNDAAEIDYPLVMERKTELLAAAYDNLKSRLDGDSEFEEFVDAHWDWLGPYSAWSVNREVYGTPDFTKWGEDAAYDPAVLDQRAAPGSEHFDDLRFHWFVQFHLHRQLNAAADHVRLRGLALKGDLPIGVAPESVDVWTRPDLFHVGTQTGAPPDAFSTRGQNWGFPTYNWPRMAEDDYAWWQDRFRAFAAYVDVYRIDHVLGFFRIWEIPPEGYDGVLGHFRPTLPLRAGELRAALGKPDLEALTNPLLDDAVLAERFGDHAALISKHFIVQRGKRPAFVKELGSQDAIRAAFAGGLLGELDQATRSRLEREVLDLVADTLLLEIEGGYSPAIAWRDSEHYRRLPEAKRQAFDELALDFFHHRHDEMWETQGRQTLPAVVGATDLLACGEDLGMVPDIVPHIMNEMGLLSLEIERMPKRLGEWIADPASAPYLSVVSPGTHDTTTLRQWWREDPELIGRYWREALDREGVPPEDAAGEIVTAILARQLASPAMLCIVPIADLLAIDDGLRRDDADAERINDPSNRHNPWKYRLHLTVAQLQAAAGFNSQVRALIGDAGRW